MVSSILPSSLQRRAASGRHAGGHPLSREDPSRRFTVNTYLLTSTYIHYSHPQAVLDLIIKQRQHASRKNPPILLLRLPQQTRRRSLSCSPAIPCP
ncbi:hypothetical protein KC322_g90 [Hortaea werneckii]|nr:hypothetical protein KC322_g90 [Hortaea werneckii]